MSWTTNIVLWCDVAQCGQSWEVRDVATPEQARERAVQLGHWAVEDGKDRCALHRSTPRSFDEILRGWVVAIRFDRNEEYCADWWRVTGPRGEVVLIFAEEGDTGQARDVGHALAERIDRLMAEVDEPS